MESILGGTVGDVVGKERSLEGWTVKWESDGPYRHWCYQKHKDISDQRNLLVIMFNPGSFDGNEAQ